MPFLRYANARVTHPHVRDWDRVRVASGVVRAGKNLVDQASKILKAEFDPSKYLLTHATIVASVDTEEVPRAKLGATTENGKKIVRKTTSFRIKSGCDQFINNNLDSWARPVLLKSYKTFVGAHSFVEHVQIENLSKGRIIDAVARDVGDSVYVDILVANDRKHEDLCKRIESGELSTLSMGCSIDGSTCTKCGHWAADETEFCDHVRFEKGNTFYDDKGQKYRVAELCGDESLEPTGGVTFVEASWVEVPAFTGAVARNVVSLDTESEPKKKKVAEKLKRVFEAPAPRATGAMQRAARLAEITEKVADVFDSDEPPAEEEAPAGPPPAASGASPLSGIETELKKFVLENLKEQLKTELSKSKIEEQVIPPSDAPNDTIIKQAARVHMAGMKKAYRASLREILATSASDTELMNRVATLNQEIGILVPVSLYRASLKVGARNSYRDLPCFLKAAGRALGREPSNKEAQTMIRLASVLGEYRTARRIAETTRSSKERQT